MLCSGLHGSLRMRCAKARRSRCFPLVAAIVLSLLNPGATVGASGSGIWMLDRWSIDQGLPNHALTDLLQTADGYLWIATWAGISRFDGVRFTPLPASLPNNHARVLLAGDEGSVWIGTGGGGLLRWHDDRLETLVSPDDLSGLEVSALARDGEGRIWITTESAVSVLDDNGLTRLDDSHGLTDGRRSTLAEGRDGQVWIAVPETLCRAVERQVDCAPYAATGRPLALLEDRVGRVWMGTSDGLFSQPSVQSSARCAARPCVVAGEVSALLEARDGALWAGLATGEVVRIQGAEVQRWGVAEGLPRGAVVALHEDLEDGIWVGSVNGGLARLKRSRVTTYSVAQGLPTPVVGSLVEDSRGTISAGANCGPVSELRGQRFFPRFGAPLDEACAMVLWAARDGSLWIGTQDRGLFHWTGGRLEHFGRDEGLSDTYVRGLFEDRDGVLWIGTDTGGLHTYADGRLSRAYTRDDGVATYILASFAQDREGRIWIGSNGNGLSVYEDGRFRILGPDESPPTRDIAGLLVDSRGDLWIGSAADGLFRRRHGRYDTFGPAQGLGDSLIAVMLEDTDGHMWVGTARGIMRLDRDRLEAVADGRARSLDPIVLDRADGMRSTEGSGGGFHPSGLRDRAGRLWFSTLDGIVQIDPAAFTRNQVVPQALVETATFGGQAVRPRPGQVVTVPPGTTAIELAYTAFSLTAPLKSRFRYRLRGFDEAWQDVGNRRTAYFSRLPPGEYLFEVEASNNDGVWSAAPARVRIAVQPYLWERREAQATALGALLLCTGWVVTKVSQQRARRRLADLERAHALERERTRIARDLHDELGARLSHIALVAEGAGRAETSVLAVAARDAVEVLDELVWTVNARHDTVAAFATYASRFAGEHVAAAGLRYRTTLVGDLERYDLSSDVRRHLYLAVKEAVSNAVRHAHATEVQLHVMVEDHTLRIDVSDNGRGLPPDGGDPTGNGLTSLRERTAAVGGTLRFLPGDGGGTRVLLTVPVSSTMRRVGGTS